MCSDIVMKGRGDDTWISNQWICDNVVIEGVPRHILGKPPRTVHLPEIYFGLVFETLLSKYPKLMEGVSETVGYYWINASWGVTSTVGLYKCKVVGNSVVKDGDAEQFSTSIGFELTGELMLVSEIFSTTENKKSQGMIIFNNDQDDIEDAYEDPEEEGLL
ncbi:uncharacterized protein LY79DRAFT_675443 [Colletotrichum navitas]|uniref:Uncharacterized protein n=1 Tax=Colletotrichum navitas TaxID=681940 RepID=A0AAD8PIF6_9PEZI|nr:uncharacterized protein LY79DRAFT_675443 [Colletotrichum navitas]KAK1561577.1 hypothetical protein LY79DRAFT_675443 [Colletotrichum navitas]